MPLPTNTNLSLLGFSRPGDALHSKIKQAVLVRLSSETLDALESLSTQPSQVQFEFGENPGIHVGDAHFPMRQSEEKAIHELFLRASSATKKNVPLKLHANIIGKFIVEPGLAGVRDKIRESTQDAANQRNSRTTVFMETPPDILQNPRKRKETPSMFRRPLRPSDKLTVPQQTSSVSASTKGVNVSSQAHLSPARRHLIQCLALGEKTEGQIMEALGTSDLTLPSRREVRDLLDLVAELSPSKGSSTDKTVKSYRLKPASWKEVRPYEWPALSDSERIAVARSARIALQNLGIPESDAVWNHVRFRAQSAAASTVTPTTDHAQISAEAVSLQKTSEVSKRHAIFHEAKERKNKPNLDTKTESTMKRESLSATSRMTLHDDMPGPSATEKRRTALDTDDAMRLHSSQVSRPVKLQASESYSLSHSLGKTVNARRAERDVALRSSGNKSIMDSRATPSGTSSQKARKKHHEDGISIEELGREKRHAKGEEAKLNNSSKLVRDEHLNSLTKRRASERSHDIPHDMTLALNPTKRRRTEYQASSVSSSRLKDPPAKEISSKKSVMDSRSSETPIQKSIPPSSVPLGPKKTGSSVPKRHTIPSSAERANSESDSRPLASVSDNSKHSSSKSRRPPIYTSSEDDELPLPTSRPLSNASVVAAAPAAKALHARNGSSSRALPADRVVLRERYNKSYAEYLETFQRLFVQKGKINDRLKGKERADSMTDSEGDADLMDSEELAKLANDHKRLEEELASIRQVFAS